MQKRRKLSNPKWEALNAIEKGNAEKARGILERLLAKGPPDPEVMNNLGAVYEILKIDIKKQIELLEKAHRLFPTHAIVRTNLARLLFNTAIAMNHNKNFSSAITQLERSLQLDPQQSLAHMELGNCYNMIGNFKQAVLNFSKAANLDPNLAGAYNGLGLTFMEMGNLVEAKGAFQKVLALEPKKVATYMHLGLLANKTGLTGIAVNMLQRALEIDPNNVATLNNLGLILREQGEIAAAYECYSKAKDLDSTQPEVSSGYLLTLNYLPGMNGEKVAQEHRRIEQVYPFVPRAVLSSNLDPRKKLHVGYLSPDFHFHSVAYFFVGLLKEHDRNEFKISCYSTGNADDQLTKIIQRDADQFISCYRWPDDVLAKKIQDDGVDVLVELTGHTRDHRLAMLRNRVVPVQVTYLGYPNTTGLSSIDLRITDAIADPPGRSDSYYSEVLARIDGGFLSYTPPQNAWKLDVGPLPALSKPGISFGSFNNLAKINDRVLEVWAQILKKLPQSSLIIKARGMCDERVLARIRKHLSAANIDETRVTLKSYELFYEEHMSCYREVDMALDTFPYAGTTTTCEALWMGVPVLTLENEFHAGRVGVSLLTRLGLEEFICQNPDDYIERAIQWANDLPRLAELRIGMRDRMQKSPLMDHRRMAQGLEQAYRSAWEKYCKSCCS